jgi:hypothetical protein
MAYKLDSLALIWFMQKEGGAIGINLSFGHTFFMHSAIYWKLM